MIALQALPHLPKWPRYSSLVEITRVPKKEKRHAAPKTGTIIRAKYWLAS
jgi:hypothetical protein